MSNNNQDAEFENLEHMMNNMMQGAFSLLFKDFGGQIFEQSNAMNEGRPHALNNPPLLDNYEGSDFRRLAKKSKSSRKAEEVVQEERDTVPLRETIQSDPMPSFTSGLSGLIGSALLSTVGSVFKQISSLPSTAEVDIKSNHDSAVSKQGMFSWNYSSSKTTTGPDGTQITTITKKTNGRTETIKRTHYPNGDIEETQEITQG
ncbi:hypothetical protein BY458DRAFT_510148 [Sporodiniella umbellata]|nr:hypothetical protein BY458DRAFT_510148 [Sporodiniella umbellata]